MVSVCCWAHTGERGALVCLRHCDTSYAVQKCEQDRRLKGTVARASSAGNSDTHLTIGLAQDGRAVRIGSELALLLPDKVCWWLRLCFRSCCPHLRESSLLLTNATGVPPRPTCDGAIVINLSGQISFSASFKAGRLSLYLPGLG